MLPTIRLQTQLFVAFLLRSLRQAARDGAPPIDLIDGEQLLDKLKELRLGITVKMVEQISVLPDFFKEI